MSMRGILKLVQRSICWPIEYVAAKVLPCMTKSRMRYLSFTFDDGFIDGAKKVDQILDPYKATFYIVTGWVKPNNVPVRDAFNRGADHGRIEDWTALSEKGHDIGSHTVSHASEKEPDSAYEFEASLDFIKQIHGRPYNFSCPHHVEINLEMPYYDTVRIGSDKTIYNNLSDIIMHRLISWEPSGHPFFEKKVFKTIAEIPDNSWMILSMHSLDGEGWNPFSGDALNRLKEYALKCGFHIKSVAQMIEIIRAAPENN